MLLFRRSVRFNTVSASPNPRKLSTAASRFDPAADRSALVLFSGGQDSTICLGWALEKFERVETLAFDYGQRHSVELECRKSVVSAIRALAPEWGPKIGEDHLLNVPVLGEISETSLTREADIAFSAEGLPDSFVPGRNILFLTLAASLAFRRNIRHIVGGMCETDFSGYPDCRDDTVKSTQVTLNLAMDRNFVIHTPLMWLDKADSWVLAEELGGSDFVDVVVENTHTCYLGDRSHRWEWGYGCSKCPACELRARGYEQWKASTAATATARAR